LASGDRSIRTDVSRNSPKVEKTRISKCFQFFMDRKARFLQRSLLIAVLVLMTFHKFS